MRGTAVAEPDRGGSVVAALVALALALAAALSAQGARGQEPEPGAGAGAGDAAQAPEAPAPEAPAPAAAPARPPAPIYTKPPETPIEYWDAADYLVRTGQAADAVPYLNKFLASHPDDATLIAIRDEYGVGSILRLQDHPETRALAAPIAAMLNRATRRTATRPDRLARFVADLTKTREEQTYAVERLREAGPYAVPVIVAALTRPGLTDEDRALIVANAGRLDTPAVPAWVAVLDAAPTDPRLAADAAEALGQIGDRRAIPALTVAGAVPGTPLLVADSARRAVARLTGRPFVAQVRSPVRLLTDEARGYHVHAVRFPSEPVILWVWDPAAAAPAPRTVTRSEAEGLLGLKLARAALAIDPGDRPAQVVALSLALEKAVERVGYLNFPAGDPGNTVAAAEGAGPEVLGAVLRQAIADGKSDLAAVAASALGWVADPSGPAVDGRINPLVAALSAPGRRARFAAARALVRLDPRRPFAGSSGVVPVLAQFVTNQGAPRALVIDGNAARGGLLAGHLKALGFEPALARTGREGFRIAADAADIELILLDVHSIEGDWRMQDTLANLRADARTAGIPVYVVAPLMYEADLMSLPRRFPGVKTIVTPPDPRTLGQLLAIAGFPAVPSPAERASYAREAAALLAEIATRPNSPFEQDLAAAEPALSVALSTPGPDAAAAVAMGDVPLPDAQRGLADVVADPGRPAALRRNAAAQLSRSLRQFGPMVTGAQEVQLANAFDRETDPSLRAALGSVVGALRPKAIPTGLRLRRLAPGSAPAPAPAPVPAPGSEAEPEPMPAPAASPSPEAAPAPAETAPEPK